MTELIEPGVPGRYWHPLEDGRIQCDLCPRFCKLHEGQRGLCFVRARQDDQIVLTTYGRSSGFCIDPIEKKPLNHFLPGTPVLSFGTAGCNLTCKFCQNWDISKAREFDRLQDLASPEAIAEAAVASGCRSVAFTYNDPVIFLEYAIDVAQACRERGIKTVAVSAGYICDGAAGRVLPAHGRGQHRPEGLHRAVLQEPVLGPARPGARDAGVPEARDGRLVRDHDAADPGRERLARRDRGAEPLGHGARWARTCRCTSRPSIPTGRCWTSPPRRPRRFAMARGIAQEVGLRYVFTATSTTRRARALIAMPARRC